jgi:HlyD family secretion protein
MPMMAVLLAVLAGVAMTWLAGCDHLAGGPAVTLVEVQEAPLRKTVVASGRVSSAVQVQLGALISGRVAATPVDAGANVGQGALLLRLQDAAETAALRQPGLCLAQAQLQLEEAERQFKRAQELSARGMVSQSQFETEKNRVDLARNQIQVSRAAIDLAQAQLAETAIRAPAEGVLLRREVEVGDLVKPGAPVMTLAVKGPVEVRVDADERHLAELALGQQATVIADAYPDRPFAAVVTEIAPLVDRQRGTVEVKLAVTTPPAFLRNDMTASAEIRIAEQAQALLLPATAVQDADGEAWVWRVVDGAVQRQAVTVGLRDRELIQIRSGLAAGEQVVAGTATLQDGQRVRRAGNGVN